MISARWGTVAYFVPGSTSSLLGLECRLGVPGKLGDSVVSGLVV